LEEYLSNGWNGCVLDDNNLQPKDDNLDWRPGTLFMQELHLQAFVKVEQIQKPS
jgi:hypothetical protein